MRPGGRPPHRPGAPTGARGGADAPDRGAPRARAAGPDHGPPRNRPAAPDHGARVGAPERGAPRDRPASPDRGVPRDRPAAPERGAPRDRPAAVEHGVTRNRDAEIKVCGRHACSAVFARRAGRILRVYLTEELLAPFGELLHACAQMHRPYRVVGAEELERITESRHHEGICVVVSALPPRSLAELLAPPGPACVVALAGVENPHNTGAIVRTAAHFGARAILIEGAPKRLPPVVYRTAQGGAEWVDVVAAPALPASLAEARRAGFTICATSSHGGTDLFAAAIPARTVIVLGAEDAGLSPALAKAADLTLRIPGSGHVESLNVATATAVLLAEVWRRHASP